MAKNTAKIGQRSVLGFDFGTKYIGIAIGQELTGSASPLGSVKANDGIPNWDNIEKYLKEWQPDLVVVGLPLNMYRATDDQIGQEIWQPYSWTFWLTR